MKILASLSIVVLLFASFAWLARQRRARASTINRSETVSRSEVNTPLDPAARDATPSSQAREPLKLPLVNPRIRISKGARRLELYSDGRLVRAYRVALGRSPVEDKERAGDYRTPEGEFYVCVKNAASKFYLSLGLSYPSKESAARGLRAGLIMRGEHARIVRALDAGLRPPWDTALGGEIFIHGGGTASDWTWGCVALDDADIRELFDAVPKGTKVVIEH
jgi:lipoprotein-anchoring transpeptidase ErfK/SrfK